MKIIPQTYREISFRETATNVPSTMIFMKRDNKQIKECKQLIDKLDISQ